MGLDQEIRFNGDEHYFRKNSLLKIAVENAVPNKFVDNGTTLLNHTDLEKLKKQIPIELKQYEAKGKDSYWPWKTPKEDADAALAVIELAINSPDMDIVYWEWY